MNGRVHKTLRLQHHRHTARRLEHHHTSYRSLWVVLAFVALCIGTIQRVSADDYGVTATVPSAVLDEAAVIVSPSSGTIVHDAELTVSGTCQPTVDGTIVSLERSGVFIGSDFCASNGTFSIVVTLIEGLNQLLPKGSTTLGAIGPDGQPVDVTYEIIKAIPPTQGGTVSQPTVPTQAALNLGSNNEVLTYGQDGTAYLQVTIASGTAPYKVVVDWGDGVTDAPVVVSRPGMVSFRHVYQVFNAYTVIITVTDAEGNVAVLQLPAIKVGPLATSYANPVVPTIGDLSLTPSFNRLIWGAYISVAAGVISIWAAGHLAAGNLGILAHVPVPNFSFIPKRRR